MPKCILSGGYKRKRCNYSLCNVVFRFYGNWRCSLEDLSKGVLVSVISFQRIFWLLQVGIQVFVTGGIGGVHRHANHSKFHARFVLYLSFSSYTVRNSVEMMVLSTSEANMCLTCSAILCLWCSYGHLIWSYCTWKNPYSSDISRR